MEKSFLNNLNLEAYIDSLNIGDEEKAGLKQKIPEMNAEERIVFFGTLSDIRAADQEKERIINL